MKAYVITACVALAIGAVAGRFLAPPKVEIQEKWHVVTVRDTTRTRETTKPDGTRIVERTETRTNTKENTDRLTTPHPRWSASLLGGATVAGGPVLGGHVQYRLIGPLTVGAWGLGGNVFAGGISLGVTF